MTDVLTPTATQKFFDNNGRPANGFRIFTYAAGTDTKLATKESANGADNDNPIVLNFRGEADIWIPPNIAYKYVFAPPGSDDPPTSTIWSVDQIVSSQLLTLYGGVDTGSANTYVLTFDANFTNYTDGVIVYWIPSNTNTLSAPSLNINGIGAIPIENLDGSILSANTIVAGQVTQVMYLNGAWKFIPSAPISGNFTGTLTGVTAVVTATCLYTLSGRVVTVRLPSTLAGTSNANTCTVTGMPTFLSPTSAGVVPLPNSSFLDNSASVSTVRALVSAAFPGTITFQLNGSSTGFNAGAVGKGIGESLFLTWMVS